MATFDISAVARKSQATANGSTNTFSFAFSVNVEADVAVFVGTTLKTISTHYTVSITSSTGAGSITFTTGNTPTNGQIVTIMSKTALARTSVYTSGGTISAASLESDFDTNMMLFQQQDERLDRAMVAPVDDAASIDMTLPSSSVRASNLLGFDSSGQPSVSGLVTSTNIANNAVGTTQIADNSVTTAKIDDAQITVAKMAANSVDSAQYVDGSIDTAHIADAQITTAKINADAVTNAKLADNSVDSEQYVDGSIDTAHIADLNVTQAKIAGEAINESKLQVSNSPVNGYVLTAQSGNTGGLTWSAASDGGLASLVADSSPQLGGALDVNGQDIVSTSNGAIELDPNGSGKVTFKGNSTRGAGQFVLNCEQNSHGITVKGPPHSAGASYTLTLPNTDGSANEVLKTDGSGNLSWVAQTTDTNTTYSVGDGGLTQNNFTNTLKSKLDGIAASANNYVHPNHSGEVTSTADGATVIADDVVDEANLKVSNSPVNGYALTAQSGNTGGLTWAAMSGGGDPDLYADNYDGSSTKPSATGTNAIALQDSAVASGNRGIAFGRSAVASGIYSISLGVYTDSINAYGTALGYQAQTASGDGATALTNSYASGADSLAGAIGNNTSSYGATGANTVSLGKTAKSTATGAFSGGYGATAGGVYAAALGFYATANGYGSTALGVESKAQKDYSFSSGKHSQTEVEGSRVHGAGIFAAQGDQQSGLYLLAASTTDATATVLTANQATAAQDTQLAIKSNQVITFHGTVVATQNGVQSVAGWEIKGLLQNDGGTTTLVNSAITVINNASNWGLALTANDTLDCMAITVTGEASHNIRWLASINTSEIIYA